MVATVWLVAIIVIPLVVLYWLKVNAAAVFLALCLGYVLLAFDEQNAYSLTTGQVPFQLKQANIFVNLALLLGPALITLFIQIGSLHGKLKYFNILPALGVGLFVALLVVPELPTSLHQSITSTTYWVKLVRYQATIVGVSATVAAVFFWLNLRKQGGEKKHHAKEKT